MVEQVVDIRIKRSKTRSVSIQFSPQSIPVDAGTQQFSRRLARKKG
jgi:hypothetical protein